MPKNKTILAVVANSRGEVFEHPDLLMVGMNGSRIRLPYPDEMIPLPEGSRLFTLPHTTPTGIDRKTRKAKTIDRLPRRLGGDRIQAVAAFPAPAYMRTLLPAMDCGRGTGNLSLWAYTAVGWCLEEERFYAAAVRVDKSEQWNPDNFDDRLIEPQVRKTLKEYPHNRLLEQLARCALDYHCFAAKNLFLQRWEAPLPTSPVCNARCLGCISLQESECCPASQERITFVPTVEELCEVAVPHLKKADNAIVSFGQGCEGEPILQAERICDSVRAMRRQTPRGTINFNTNGSIPEAVDRLAEAGIDSIRISLNSVRKHYYQAYYRTEQYAFEDVIDAIRRAKNNGLYTMLNYLVFPGLNDQPAEVDTLEALLEETGIDMIQVRNLSIDPVQYIREMSLTDEGMGMKRMLDHIKRKVPHIQYGYFNRTRETFFPPGFENDWPINTSTSSPHKKNSG
ncbi:MAG: radical SAM protein [Deltaproteobacteria bacterium]|nr:radical SAM protein [Deltaproteobacteria bacterium]